MTDLFCKLMDFLGELIEKYMPVLSVPEGMTNILDAFDYILNFIGQINFLVPLPTIFTITALIYTFKLSKFLLFIVNWFIRRFRGG